MKTTIQGKLAEAAVAKYLSARGYDIVELNWRGWRCEIDIIAKKNDVMLFVEVKYRTSDAQGTGFDYITAAKLKQMRFAAGVWLAQSRWTKDSRLAAAQVSGSKCDNVILTEIS